METALSGEPAWHPGWPRDLPPDAFELTPAAPPSAVSAIELSNGIETLSLRRDSAGRLIEFPFFDQAGIFRVRAAYTQAGALRSLNIIAPDNVAPDSTSGDTGQPEESEQHKPLSAEFPPEHSAPIQVRQEDRNYFVYILESNTFISETWYDEEGNLFAYHKASINRKPGTWRIQSLESRDSLGPRSLDYAFDAAGNVTEIRFSGGACSALYTDRRPVYWQTPDSFRAALQWDETRRLVSLRPETAPVEYRYRYEQDKAGNWTKRQEIAILNHFGVYAPRPGPAWTRKINYRN
jgi:hypothetical protein